MNNEGIYGHKKQLNFLQNAAAKDKLAHGYIFSGPEGVGKRTIARKLARLLLSEGSPSSVRSSDRTSSPARGEDNLNLSNQPDYLEIDGKEGIKIEQIRDLIYKLSLKPYSAKFKVALIDCAEEMTIEAANALLKSLEEPKPHTIIILITSNPNRLPKTILSRAQKITFGPVKFEEFEALLPEKLDKHKKELIKTLAAGRPGLALKISSDEDFLQKLDETEEYFKRFDQNSAVERLILAYDLAELETHEIKSILDSWTLRLETRLKENPDAKTGRTLQEIAKSIKYLGQNANSKLLLTNLMLNV